MIVLAIDTSTQTGGVAVLRGDSLLAQVEATSTRTHAKRLMSAVDSALRMAGMGVDECDGLAVTTGPGSFTGLRIGISAVKGLGFAMGKPVAGVSTLDVLAYQFPWFPDLVCPMLDARKEEIYTALYRCSHDAGLEKITSDCAVEPTQWLMQIKAPCLFVGDGAVVYRDLIEECLGSRAQFAPPYLNTLQASVVAYIGMKQIERGETTDVALLAPNYLRKSDAEIKLEKGRLVDK
jgi:tRNA threonylcarbamoyladenosine biosynthesis protein TsaB